MHTYSSSLPSSLKVQSLSSEYSSPSHIPPESSSLSWSPILGSLVKVTSSGYSSNAPQERRTRNGCGVVRIISAVKLSLSITTRCAKGVGSLQGKNKLVDVMW